MLNAVTDTMGKVVHWIDFVFAASSRVRLTLSPINNRVPKGGVLMSRVVSESQGLVEI